MRIHFVIQRGLYVGPGAQGSRIGAEVAQKRPLAFLFRRDQRIRPQRLPDQIGKGHDVKALFSRAETIEVATRQHREIARIGYVEDTLGATRIGRV